MNNNEQSSTSQGSRQSSNRSLRSSRSRVGGLTLMALVTVIALSGAVMTSAPASAGVNVDFSFRVPFPAPALRYETIGVRPSRDHVWVGGYWNWRPEFRRYAWVPGSWAVRPYARAVWYPAHHEFRGGVWYYHRGCWR